jgi:hypothetical protein
VNVISKLSPSSASAGSSIEVETSDVIDGSEADVTVA